MSETNENPLAAVMAALEERMKNLRTRDEIEYPIEVSKITFRQRQRLGKDRVGRWASIRPAGSEYAGKTFLGIYLGDLINSGSEAYDVVTKELDVMLSTNPAIYVPDLKKIVWGCESWWRLVSSPEDLRKITDADIADVWYVRALKELSEQGEQ